MRLTTGGVPVGFTEPFVGKIARTTPPGDRSEYIRLLDLPSPEEELCGYRAILTASKPDDSQIRDSIPLIHSLRDVDHLNHDYIVLAQPGTGVVRTVYRPDSTHNALFITERCSSNCLMCSQPPKDRDDTNYLFPANLEIIRMIAPGPEYLGITGGEPTLLGSRLPVLLAALREYCPQTHLHMLTNGRLFAWPDVTRALADVNHRNLTLGIPLYSDDAVIHNHIVQAQNAFEQTVLGLHQLAKWQQEIEIRVVLHQLSIPRLVHLAEYIYRNLPFVGRVALMGLEPTGYTPRNKEQLWIDPVDYQDKLEQAVEYLSIRGMSVAIYNLQLCVLRRSLWKYARKSISDWKNIYLPACEGCSAREECGGFFQSADRLHSAYIQPIAS